MDIYASAYLEGKDKTFDEEKLKSIKGIDLKNVNILSSYFYVKDIPIKERIKQYGLFLLDSGAFTFLSKEKARAGVDWDEYVESYAKYITDNDIKLFMELDIDLLVGLKKVEMLRYKLERMTGKKPIPVWHKGRGKEGFIRMCENYPYVAVGGIVTHEIPRHIYEKMFPWFINTAHKHGAKIHGLGVSTETGIRKVKFDSVDNTDWTYGAKCGFIYRFFPDEMRMRKTYAKDGMKLADTKDAATRNLGEFIKSIMFAKKL